MNIEAAREAIECCRRELVAESYQDYLDAMKAKDPKAAVVASDLTGTIETVLSDLKSIIEDYDKAQTND